MIRRAGGSIVVAMILTSAVFACQSPAATPEVVSPVDGVVIKVDATGLTDVRGFTLRRSDGLAFDFTIGRLENGAEFPPGHLAEHMASSSPVRVFFHLEGGLRVVTRLEDAPQ